MSQNECFIIDATTGISTNISMLGQLVVLFGRCRGENGYHSGSCNHQDIPIELNSVELVSISIWDDRKCGRMGSCKLRWSLLTGSTLMYAHPKTEGTKGSRSRQCISEGENSKSREAATLSKDQCPMCVTMSSPRVREGSRCCKLSPQYCI